MDERDIFSSSSSSHGKSSRVKEKKKGWWLRRKSWQKAVIAGLGTLCVFLVLIIAGVGSYIYAVINDIHRDDEFGNLDNSDLGIAEEITEDVINIALFGVDAREKGVFEGNSDSIMVLSIQKNENKIKIISIMRDSLVPINDGKNTIYSKINAAYQRGGSALAVRTLNQTFGLDIRDYATVNFYGMGDIVDAVGGISADITQAEINNKNYGINATIKEQCMALGLDPEEYYIKTPGVQHLNGAQAVSYARIRYVRTADGESNDFGRVERQQHVMQQLLQKALMLEAKDYPNLVKKLTPHVKTSLSNGKLLGLVKLLANKPELIRTRVPSDEYIINSDFRETGASTVYYNYEYAATIIYKFLYENIMPEEYIATYGVDKKPWYGR